MRDAGRVVEVLRAIADQRGDAVVGVDILVGVADLLDDAIALRRACDKPVVSAFDGAAFGAAKAFDRNAAKLAALMDANWRTR